jgi:hypothetical protein
VVIYMFNEDDTNVEIQAVKKAMRKNKNFKNA